MSDTDQLPRPPVAGAPLSVLLLFPESESSRKGLLAAWETFLAKPGRDYEILFLDDGKLPRLENPRLRPLALEGTPGIGAALRAGLAAAKYPLLVCASGDRRYRPEDLNRLLERIDAADLVVGCRVRPMPSGLRYVGWFYRAAVRILTGIPLEPMPSWLGWKNWFYHLVLRLVAGIRLHDVNSGLQLFRREIVTDLPVRANGAFAQAEIIAKANFLGGLMDEVPIEGPAEDLPLWPMLAEGYRVLSHAEFGRRDHLA